jgi:hypothetical protein
MEDFKRRTRPTLKGREQLGYVGLNIEENLLTFSAIPPQRNEQKFAGSIDVGCLIRTNRFSISALAIMLS